MFNVSLLKENRSTVDYVWIMHILQMQIVNYSIKGELWQWWLETGGKGEGETVDRVSNSRGGEEIGPAYRVIIFQITVTSIFNFDVTLGWCSLTSARQPSVRCESFSQRIKSRDSEKERDRNLSVSDVSCCALSRSNHRREQFKFALSSSRTRQT